MRGLRCALVLLVLPLLVGFNGMRGGTGSCPSPRDFQGSMWQDAASTTGCSAAGCQVSGSEFMRWTRQAMADCEGCLLYMLGADADRGLPMMHTSPAISFLSSTIFDMHFASGNPRLVNVANTAELIADVRSKVRPGRRGPIFVADIRWDIVQRWQLDQAAPYAIDKSWLLRSDRPIQAFGAFIAGLGGGATYSHCRAPNGSDTTEQYDDPEGGTRCNRTFGSGGGTREWGVRIYDQLEALEDGLGDNMAAYVTTTDAPNFYPVATLLNLKHPDAQNWLVGQCAALRAQGFDACDFPHKRHHFCVDGSAPPCTTVQYWPVIAGDGLGGTDETMGLGLDSDLDTLAELEALPTGDIYSGPPEIPNGVAGCTTAGGCPYLLKDYAQGRVETQRKNTAAGNPTVVTRSPYLWIGCPKNPGDWDSAYNDVACTNRESDADATACEACTEREIAQRATYVLINLGNKPLWHPSIGSGAGSGFSFDELKHLILNPPGGGPRPREVYPYNEYQGGETNARGTPARICGDPNQILAANPEPGIGAATCELDDCTLDTDTLH